MKRVKAVSFFFTNPIFMKNIVFLILFICSISCKKNEYRSIQSVHNTQNLLKLNFKYFANEINTFEKITKNNATADQLRDQFKKTRLAFKKTEEFIAYYFPSSFIKINGAPIDENDLNETNRKIEYATGFQKIEELIFQPSINKFFLSKNIEILKGHLVVLTQQINNLQLNDSNIFEIQKLQLLRVLSLGITGFDSALALHSLPEAQSSLRGIQEVVNSFQFDKSFNTAISKAISYLKKNNSFNTFDRAVFITQYANPIFQNIFRIQQELYIKNNPFLTAINFNKKTPFETEAYDPNYFAPFYNKNPSKLQIHLGKQLFFDKILSGNNQISCASCHIPNQAYADHKTKAVANKTSRNTPTLLNAGLQNTQFADNRIRYLEDQAKAVINNPDEMHGSFTLALKKLNKNQMYRNLFHKVFPSSKNITEENLLQSIASFVRSLSKLNSKFDEYLRGKASLTIQEKKGFNLFMGKGKCATCHFFPLFNGSIPPLYQKTESEILGVPSRIHSKQIDPDLGEYHITKAPLKKYAFKTPTVRNASITFPYMHNGVFNTLEEVINFYNKGGGKGNGIIVEHQTLAQNPLLLSKEEMQNIIRFIQTLNNP